MLAKAMAQEPDILLLDEPTNHLDIKNQLEILNIISHFRSVHNISSLISIHDLNMALRYADRLLILKDGKILFFDKCELLTSEILYEVYGVRFLLQQISRQTVLMPIMG